MTEDSFYRLTPIELATSWLPGVVPPDDPQADEGKPGSPPRPRLALEEILTGLLQRQPCFIGFSGGRDSSALLALAVHIARREGLPTPTPLTRIYEGVAEADETEWQEQVIRHLGLPDWERLILTDDDDLIGPLARPGLHRYGVLWPLTIHTKRRELEHVRGGTVITGDGGDEVFGPLRITPLTGLVQGRAGRLRTAGKQALKAVLPGILRRKVGERMWRPRITRPWLRPWVQEAFLESVIHDMVNEPLRWDRHVRRIARTRGQYFALRNFELKARREADVSYETPFLDDRFLTEWARLGGMFGFPDRTTAMRRLFRDLLPDGILARETKGTYNFSVFNRHSARFVREWDGEGAYPEMVDPIALRTEWLSPMPHGSTYLLLQQAWLTSNAF